MIRSNKLQGKLYGVFFGIAGAIAIAIPNLLVQAQIWQNTIVGESGGWTMTAKNPWMGGSSTQIQQLLAGQLSDSLRKILGPLERAARASDALLVSVEIGDELPGQLYIDFDRSPPLPVSEWTEPYFSVGGPAMVESKLPNGSRCKYTSMETSQVAGEASVRGYFVCRLLDGNQVHASFEVAGTNTRQATFLLLVDSRVRERRYADYRAMLMTFRYL